MTDPELLAACGQIHGWMYDEELLWLRSQAAGKRLVVEIGVWRGRSTLALACGAGGMVVGIDHWQGSPEERTTAHAALATEEGRQEAMAAARANLAPYIDAGRCRLIEGDSAAVAEAWGYGPIDMLFLDASHDRLSVERDLAAWIPHLRTGALLCGHDRTWPGVAAAMPPDAQHGPGSIWWTTTVHRCNLCGQCCRDAVCRLRVRRGLPMAFEGECELLAEQPHGAKICQVIDDMDEAERQRLVQGTCNFPALRIEV